MAFRFKLYDEDDPLAEFGEGYTPDYDTSSPALAEQLQAPPDSLESLLSPDAGSYQAPMMMAGQDRELEQAYRARELDALRSSSDQGYGWAEGIRDVAPAAIGLLVDGIANKGRGAANIVGVTAQQAAANQAYDRAQRQKDAELAVRLHQRNGSRFLDPYAQVKLDHAAERIRLQAQGQHGVQGRFDANAASRDNFDSQRRQTERDQVVANARGRELGRAAGETQVNPQDVENRSNIAAGTSAASTQAKIDTELAMNPEVSSAEASKAAAREAATTNAATDALRANPRDLTKQQQLEEQHRQMAEGQRVKESRRAAADQFTKESEYVRGIASQLDRIERVMQKYPEGELATAGVGFGQQFGFGFGQEGNDTARGLLNDFGISDQSDALEMSNARAILAEMAQRKESGAAGPESEKLRYLIRTGAQPNATETQFRIAIQAARDLTQMQLASFSVGKEDAADEVLNAGQLGGWIPQRPKRPPPPPGRGVDASWNHDGVPTGDLGDTGRVRDVPPIPINGADDWRARYERFKLGGGAR